MLNKFQIGDRVRFENQDGIAEGIGVIAGVGRFRYYVRVEEIVSIDSRYRPGAIQLHGCGKFDTDEYWNVDEGNIVEVLDSSCKSEISSEDLELILNG